jgi:hypothetical protein
MLDVTYLNGLTTRVVEFTSLSNRSTPRTEHEDLLDHGPGRCRLAARKDDTIRGLAARIQKRVKHEFRVGRTGRSFGVELGRKVGPAVVGNTFVTAVVGVGEESLPARLESVTVDVVSVVLRRNVALASLVVQDRLVLTAVTKGELLSLTTGSKTDQLVTHTDTENRLDLFFGAIDDLLELFNSSHAHVRVTRTVTQKETVELVQIGGKGVVPGNDSELDTAFAQLTDNVELHTAIDGKDLGRVSLSVNDDFLGADLVDQVPGVGVNHLGEIRGRGAEIDLNTTKHGTLLTNLLGEHTSIEISETGDAFFFEPIAQTASGIPVRIHVTVILDQETRSVDPVGLEVSGETIVVLGVAVRNTVVSHHGRGEGQNLALVRRIGQTFGVSNHSSGEDDLQKERKREVSVSLAPKGT